MKKSEQIHNELKKAKISAGNIKNSKSLNEIDENWKNYLSQLERVWSKSQAHFKKSPKWNTWQGRYVKLRRQDELLAYLINARGADEHTVEEITQKQSGGYGFSAAKPGGVVEIKNLRTGPKGEILNLEVGDGVIVSAIPSRIRLLPITNRGVNYPTPRTHLGKEIDSENLVTISEAGVNFYENFLNSAEDFFCTDK